MNETGRGGGESTCANRVARASEDVVISAVCRKKIRWNLYVFSYIEMIIKLEGRGGASWSWGEKFLSR